MDVKFILRDIVGKENILLGKDCTSYKRDWTGKYISTPLAVVKPSSTLEVSKVLKVCYENGVAIVPISGNTGLSGGTSANNSIMLSLERLNKIHKIKIHSRTAIVDAGVKLSDLHSAVEELDLIFPLTFGAKGSAMIGGVLSTNAGGSNVLKYGNTRTLCMGLEVVLPDGRILDLMSELHKDNTGYDLKDLVIGAEGTLGIITAAVLKLSPKPVAYTTAMIATSSLNNALKVLNILQESTGGAVEAFEYMPKNYIETHLKKVPNSRPPFDKLYDLNIMLEIGSTIAGDSISPVTGKSVLTESIEEILSQLLISGELLDAVIAQSESQRIEMWERREASAEITITNEPLIITDVAVPLEKISIFIEKMDVIIQQIDPGSRELTVAHLGDGNIHYAIYPTKFDEILFDKLTNRLEEVTQELGGSFSAEHGIGLSKKKSMARRKDPVALEVMRSIKIALDPKNLMNPGKVLPDP
ncbi:MAG: FAD-binding oxidoreductase [Paracoccaceae bacterium]